LTGRCCIFFINGLGDHFVVLPALRALVATFPNECVLVTGHGVSELLFTEMEFSQVIKVKFEPTHEDPHNFDFKSVAVQVGRVDIFVSLSSWCTQALLHLRDLVAPGISVGVCGPFDLVIEGQAGMHMAEQFFEVARVFNSSLVIEEFSQPIPLPDRSSELAFELRALLSNRRLLVVHPEPSVTQKRWQTERFSKLIRMLIDSDKTLFVLVVTRGPAFFEEDFGHSFLQVAGANLPIFLGAISAADFFIGVDSVGLHIADCFNVLGVALFGPTDPKQWGFRNSTGSICVSGTAGMESISTEDVFTAYKAIASKKESFAGSIS
jgi:ADP-heptose:LPS heptosyltransferase